MDKVPQVHILYEDDDIVAVDKPAGLMVHPDAASPGPFLTDWIVERFPHARGVGEPARSSRGDTLDRSGIVHRLDRGTSGVMLVATTDKGFQCLKKQFQDHVVKKKYVAFVWGELVEDFGTINRPIGRSSSDFRKWSASRGARGDMREAETYWVKKSVVDIESSEIENRTGKVTLVEIEPRTGRTHQIRVHFSAIHHPVVGDMLYAPRRPYILGFDRIALHARTIEFENCKGERICVNAPFPSDFAHVFRNHNIHM